MVLKGRAGILMPHGARPWVGSIGDETLGLLNVVAFHRDVKNEGIDVEPSKSGTGTPQKFDGKTN